MVRDLKSAMDSFMSNEAMNVDFMYARIVDLYHNDLEYFCIATQKYSKYNNHMIDIIDLLLHDLESMEEYEKCAKLLTIRNYINDNLDYIFNTDYSKLYSKDRKKKK